MTQRLAFLCVLGAFLTPATVRAAEGCFRMADQTITCTPQGFALLVSEARYQTDLAARVTAENARLSTELHAARVDAARQSPVWPLFASAGVGVVVGAVVGVLLSR